MPSQESLAAWGKYDEVVEYRIQSEGGKLSVGQSVFAFCKNKEVKFSCPEIENGKEMPIDALGLTEFDKVNLLGKLLYKYAERGFDPDPSDAKGAVCHIVSDKRMPDMHRVFIGTNQNHRSRAQRPDAEMTALEHAKEVVGINQLHVDETFLTLRHSGTKAGDLITPCGTCREELTNHKVPYFSKESLLYCLPCQGEGEMKPIMICDHSDRAQPDISQAKRGEAFKQRTDSLVPYKDMRFPARCADRLTADVIKEGMDWVKDTSKQPAPLTFLDGQLEAMQEAATTGREEELTLLQGDGGFTPERVNAYLFNKIKAQYMDLSSHKDFEDEDLYKIRAAVVKLADGRCYGSVYVDSKGRGAKPLGELSALSNAGNPVNVNDVYVMEMKPKRIIEQQEEAHQNPDYEPKARAVFPEALGRIFKAAKVSSQRWVDKMGKESETRCLIHTLPLNNGKLSSEELESLIATETIEALQPGPFQSPNGASQGCCK